MGVSDQLPIDPDYPVGRTREPNEIVHRAASAEEFRRLRAPARRIFSLTWGSLSATDWETLESFRLQMLGDFFDFLDKSSAGERHYSCRFLGELDSSEIGNEQFAVRGQLIEAPGAALAVYPETPLIELPAGSGQVVSDGVIFWYSGYGYTITGSGISDVELDAVSLGADLEKFDVPLAMHQLKIQPETATITKVEVVH